ncbi:STAS domain-containing protein [Phytohabitans rumicis]|uniref:Anti-sigma factor antagonist n=1 Tax=Phytohabitans rumicis TaxID=1076125 RepID=A0A6V8LIV7_9ACTN|nr:STAS domain-containing protein [Phytohabitans rumicis]GFJ94778.1 hypothetical protein Prum_084200 [Phytohabitans rumicis]
MTLVRTEPCDSHGLAVVHLHGDVDIQNERSVVAAVAAALDGPVREVVVDLTNVPFLDSSGVRALLRGRQAAETYGATLRVRNPRRIVDQILRITGVAPLLGLGPVS